MINPADNNKVTELGSATHICAKGDILYLVYSEYYSATNFFLYLQYENRKDGQ